MASKIFSCNITGLNCEIIEVQADVSAGMPYFAIVGLGDTSVQEAKERVHSGIKNSGAKFPLTRKIINLAPAQVKKQGSLFDLPIAVSILADTDQLKTDKFKDAIIVGELSLSGKLKPINGVLAITQYAKEKDFKKIFLPRENALEASFIEGVEIYPLEDLRELIDFSFDKINLQVFPHQKIDKFKERKISEMATIVGLDKAKRALSIAAAGGHNIMLYGSPGYGKTVLCRAFRSLLPKMSDEEILQITKIFSVSGLLDKEHPLIVDRPFREVHHTASLNSIVGGGNFPRPGEISLAHNGVLFFDEIAEFPRQVLEALRQPLEDKTISITRVNGTGRFPCNFIFLATMNPCPCGYLNDKKVPCRCTKTQICHYQKKLSGPLLDRFDLFMEVPNTPLKNIFQKKAEENDLLITSIENAQKIQQKRFEKNKKIFKNADMNLTEIKEYCHLEAEAEKILNNAAENLHLSNRGYLKTIKIGRTIADMEGAEQIAERHIAEALQYRQQN